MDAGRVSAGTIAKRQHRPESSVVNKLKRFGNSRRVREGYTMRDLEQCLGEDHHKIAAWIASGWLKDRLQGTRRHGGNGNDIHRIQEKDILEFLKNHPQEINFGKVDQMCFSTSFCCEAEKCPKENTQELRKLMTTLWQRNRGHLGQNGLDLPRYRHAEDRPTPVVITHLARRTSFPIQHLPLGL